MLADAAQSIQRRHQNCSAAAEVDCVPLPSGCMASPSPMGRTEAPRPGRGKWGQQSVSQGCLAVIISHTHTSEHCQSRDRILGQCTDRSVMQLTACVKQKEKELCLLWPRPMCDHVIMRSGVCPCDRAAAVNVIPSNPLHRSRPPWAPLHPTTAHAAMRKRLNTYLQCLKQTFVLMWCCSA